MSQSVAQIPGQIRVFEVRRALDTWAQQSGSTGFVFGQRGFLEGGSEFHEKVGHSADLHRLKAIGVDARDRQAVFDRAREAMGVDLVKTEKFSTSIRDGIDIRDTLRHWYAGEIYVKVLPPNRGRLDCAVMLFDSPADPREYPWRATWFAEHKEESTLCFFASDFSRQPIGPGICQAIYGGAMFFFPAIPIPDIWTDSRLDFTETLEERMLAAADTLSLARVHLPTPSPRSTLYY